MRRLGALALVLFFLAGFVVAAATDAPQADPRTPVERLEFEVLTLKAQLARAIADGDACRAELTPVRTAFNQRAIQDEAERLVAKQEAAHPGYRMNRTTGVLEAAPEKPSAKGTP